MYKDLVGDMIPLRGGELIVNRTLLPNFRPLGAVDERDKSGIGSILILAEQAPTIHARRYNSELVLRTIAGALMINQVNDFLCR